MLRQVAEAVPVVSYSSRYPFLGTEATSVHVDATVASNGGGGGSEASVGVGSREDRHQDDDAEEVGARKRNRNPTIALPKSDDAVPAAHAALPAASGLHSSQCSLLAGHATDDATRDSATSPEKRRRKKAACDVAYGSRFSVLSPTFMLHRTRVDDSLAITKSHPPTTF